MKVMTLKRVAKFARNKAREMRTSRQSMRCLVLVPRDQICPPDGWKGCDWGSGILLWRVAIYKDGRMVYSRTF